MSSIANNEYFCAKSVIYFRYGNKRDWRVN